MAIYLRQLKLGPMDNFVYLLGPEAGDEALVVDPAWDVPAIERALEQDGRRLTAAFLSHCHADHTHGVPELLERHDIPVYAQKEELAFSEDLRDFGACLRGLAPGDGVSVGSLTVKALHTPGHTPGSQCLWCGDALVSGDTLFVNACGRCDLPGGDPQALYRTFTEVLGALPPATRLLPGHDYGDIPASTLERERARNPYFQFQELASFVAYRMRPRK